MSILVTGFAPFDGESINPAWQAAQALPDTIAGLPVYWMAITAVTASRQPIFLPSS